VKKALIERVRAFLSLRRISTGALRFSKDRSRSYKPYKYNFQGISDPVDFKNRCCKRAEALNTGGYLLETNGGTKHPFMEEILERNDWITSTPMLCYRGEAVSVSNLLNKVTTLNTSSRVGAFAANEDILLNKSIKSKNYKINRELYELTPHRQFCRWGSFSAPFQLIQ
jgi:hypothetical protein